MMTKSDLARSPRWAPRAALVSVAALALGSCASPDVGRGIQLRLAAAAAPAQGGCTRFTAVSDTDFREDPVLTSALIGQSGTLRLSVLRRTADGTTSFVCDAAAKVPSQVVNLDLGPGDGAQVHAEFFDGGGALVASGMTTVSAGMGPMNLVLYPVGTFGCPGASLSAPRAFHTVLPLPTGELLIAGGLTGFGKGDAEKFQLVSGVEIFDPKLNAFYPLAEERGRVPRGRAFHRAAVLDQQNGLVRVLLYGGIADSPGKPTIVANGARAGEILRLAPADPAQMISNSELLVIDVANRQVQRPALASADSFTPAAFAGGAPLPGGGLLTAGGHFRANPDGTLTTITGFTVIPPQPESAAPTPLATKSLGAWLLGPSITVFGDGQALIYGLAHAQPGKGDSTRTIAAQVSGLPAAAMAQVVDPAPGVATAFHTATALPDKDGARRVLLTGGFVADAASGDLLDPPASADGALRVLTAPASAAPTVATVAAPSGYRPAGFEATAATASGKRALVSGGTPARSANLPECQGLNAQLCALSQAFVYDSEQGKALAAPPLGLARMGHRQTLLPDGNILITGGLTQRQASGKTLSLATAEAEVYNPRQASASEIEDPVAGPLGRPHSSAAVVKECAQVK